MLLFNFRKNQITFVTQNNQEILFLICLELNELW